MGDLVLGDYICWDFIPGDFILVSFILGVFSASASFDMYIFLSSSFVNILFL